MKYWRKLMCDECSAEIDGYIRNIDLMTPIRCPKCVEEKL